MTEHTCHAVGCGTVVAPRYLMCPRHWGMLPEILQNVVWHHYREGQEIDKEPSTDWIATAFVAISVVALQEGKRMPTLDSHIMRDAAVAALAQAAATPMRPTVDSKTTAGRALWEHPVENSRRGGPAGDSKTTGSSALGQHGGHETEEGQPALLEKARKALPYPD
jgi:hypothetical protein